MTDSTLLRSLESLLLKVQGIDIRQFEGKAASDLCGQALVTVQESVEGAIVLLREARQVYPDSARPPDLERVGDDSGVFAAQLDEAMQGDDTRERIVDVIVLGQIELGNKRVALAAVQSRQDSWAIVDALASARRRTLKVLVALVHSICAHHGIECPFASHQTELEISLEVRRVYTRFRRIVAQIPEPRTEEVGQRLREAGILLAKLIGRDAYEHMRTCDRREIWAVQRRVLDWLRTANPSPRHGVRIWQDFAALAGVLVQINHRTELREHDLAVASRLHRALAAGDGAAPIGAALLDELGRLYGRDDELDAMMLASSETPRWLFRDTLGRIIETLDPGAARRFPACESVVDDAL